MLRTAADDWAKGDPEDPSTELILRQILGLFIQAEFLRRPFGAGPP